MEVSTRKRILICDDDDDLRQTLGIILKKDYDIVEAADGSEALKIIESERLHLVLLDISMPELSGLQTLKAYHEEHPGLLTIILTSKPQIGIAKRALNRGAVAYITKPFDIAYLQDEIARVLSQPPEAEKAQGRPWHIVSPGESKRT